MITVILKKLKATFYDSADEMPIDRRRMAQQADLESNGVGWTKADHVRHLVSVRDWLLRKDLSAALTEIENTLIGWQALIRGIDLESQTLACYLYAIDGEPIADATEKDLQAAMERLVADGLTLQHLEELIDDIRKKWMGN